MSDISDVRRKRLLFRSWHRGMREADLLLGSFAEQHLAGLSEAQLLRYAALLEEDDGELFAWITGRVPPPARHECDVLRLLQSFRYRARPA